MLIIKKQNRNCVVIFSIFLLAIFFTPPQILNVYAQTGGDNATPLKQVKSGISAQDVICNDNFVLIIKVEDGSPACVKQSTVDVLIARGWGKSTTNVSGSNTGGGQSSATIITLVDNNKTIHLSKGEIFLLKLGSNYNWNVNIDNQTVVSRVPNVMVIQGAQGLYEARNPGQTVLAATGDPWCLSAIPRCGMPSILFKLDIDVPQ